MNDYRGALKKAQRALKTHMKTAAEGEKEQDVWLRENETMLRSALSAGRRLCRARAENMPVETALRFADDLCALTVSGAHDPGPDAAAGVLTRAFSGAVLTFSQTEKLPVLLFSALALRAAGDAGTPRFPDRVRAFYALRRVDFNALFPALCAGEGLLEQDPAGVYPQMSLRTKKSYRRAYAAAARRAKTDEKTYLEALLARAKREGRHVGDYLKPKSRAPVGALLLLAQAGSARAAALALGFFAVKAAGVPEGWTYAAAGLAFAGVLFFPFYTLLQPLFYKLGAATLPPRELPSLDPDRAGFSPPPSLIVVSAILPAAPAAASWERKLSDLYYASRVPDTGVLLLLDKKSADTPFLPSDETDLQAVRRLVDRLNAAGGRFAFALRPRVKNETDDDYCGYERKRGALTALSVLLTDGDGSAFEALGGDLTLLKNREYMLALDQDTELPFGALSKLLAVACHPLNRDYGCFAPRAESVETPGSTLFQALFTGGGLTAYAPAVSEFYMDAFGQGIFCGKGLLNVRRYRETCAEAFAPGRVLSHDVLEGALMNTAFVSGVQVGEHFPSSPGAWLNRRHRWVRGDAQNLFFLFRRPRKGKFNALHRFWLTDSLRRALTAPAALLTLLISAFLPSPAARLLFLLAVLSVAGDVLPDVVSLLLREGFTLPFSRRLPPAARALLRGLAQFLLLPASAVNDLDAVVRGVWRTLTKKRTLEWTTAAAAEHGDKRPGIMLLPALASSLLLSCGALSWRAAAILLLLGIPFALSNGIRFKNPPRGLSFRDREQLSDWAAATWRYFAKYAGEEDNFLPPDNVQELPKAEVAHRTSPTNVGLYLVSLLSAADLGFIGGRELETRLSAALASVSRLPLWHGLLYNWYDTRTLAPLHPAFVSSVDCGNFLVCLTCLEAGLRERRLDALAETVRAHIEKAELSALYDGTRRLFYVGYDVAAGKMTDAAYECAFSETLLTSLFAAAKGHVPASHFAALSRPVARSGARLTALSYTGTLFEYLMPALFLPLIPGAGLTEGCLSALAAQKKAVRGTPFPWGRTESGRYVLDGALRYGYRANGVKKLALKPDAAEERVFAPYASFLALAADPAGAMKNLRRFQKLGAYGACGFYEALDFEERGLGEDYMAVRSFMAHHAGMSLVAAANALTSGGAVRRFLADPEISAAVGLVRERLPAPNARFVKRSRVPEKRPRPARVPAPGRAALYRAGEAALLCLESGENRLLAGGLSLFSEGLKLRVFRDGAPVSLPTGELLPTGRYTAAEADGVLVSAGLGLLPDRPVFALPVKMKSAKAAAFRLRVTGVPYLSPLFAPDFHTAFRELFVSVRGREGLSAAVAEKRRGGEPAFAVAVGFWDSSPFTLATDRETLPPPGTPLPPREKRRGNAPVLAVETTVRVPAGRSVEKVLLVAPGASAEEALTRLTAVRKLPLPPLSKLAPNVLPPAAGELVSSLFDGSRPAAVTENFAPLSALWEQGVSGDCPLVRLKADFLPRSRVRAAARLHRLLLLSGIETDLLLFTDRAPAYGETPAGSLGDLLPRESAAMLGRSPGVHVIAGALTSPAFRSAAESAPGVSYPPAPRLNPRKPPALLPVKPHGPAENGFVPGGYYIGLETPRPWGNALANKTFGTLLTNRSLGWTWALNARLNPLTPWSADVTRAPGGETLALETDEGTFDLVNGAAVYFYPEKAVYLARAGRTGARVIVRVPEKGMEKTVEVVLSTDGTLCFRVTGWLAPPPASELSRCETGEGRLTFTNPGNADFPGVMTVFCPGASAETDGVTGTLTRFASAGEPVTFTLRFTLGDYRQGGCL